MSHSRDSRVGDFHNRNDKPTNQRQDSSNTCQPPAVNPPAVCQPALRADSQISGLVYADINKDGQAQDSERRLQGVTVTLTGNDLNGSPISRQTTTDGGGIYMFTGLPAGTYAIKVTTPTGYTPGQSSTGAFGGNRQPNLVTQIAIPEGQSSGAYNFGELVSGCTPCMPPPCSTPPPVTQSTQISGIVYLDADRDGLFEDGEQLLQGVPVTLTGTDQNGNAVSLQAMTDAAGAYQFAALAAGTYTIQTVTPIGLLPGHASVGTFGGTTGVNIVSDIQAPAGQSSPGYNFGMEEPRPR